MSRAKPTLIKQAQGTFRDDRHVENALGDNLELIKTPRAPLTLGPAGKKQWKVICDRLHNVGILHDVSLGLIESYCINYQAMQDSMADMELHGKYTESGRVHPAWRVLQESMKEMRAIASHFGFTPATATKLPLPQKKELNAFQKLQLKQ